MERLSPILGKALLRPYGDVELRHEEEIDPSLSKARGSVMLIIMQNHEVVLDHLRTEQNMLFVNLQHKLDRLKGLQTLFLSRVYLKNNTHQSLLVTIWASLGCVGSADSTLKCNFKNNKHPGNFPKPIDSSSSAASRWVTSGFCKSVQSMNREFYACGSVLVLDCLAYFLQAYPRTAARLILSMKISFPGVTVLERGKEVLDIVVHCLELFPTSVKKDMQMKDGLGEVKSEKGWELGLRFSRGNNWSLFDDCWIVQEMFVACLLLLEGLYEARFSSNVQEQPICFETAVEDARKAFVSVLSVTRHLSASSVFKALRRDFSAINLFLDEETPMAGDVPTTTAGTNTNPKQGQEEDILNDKDDGGGLAVVADTEGAEAQIRGEEKEVHYLFKSSSRPYKNITQDWSAPSCSCAVCQLHDLGIIENRILAEWDPRGEDIGCNLLDGDFDLHSALHCSSISPSTPLKRLQSLEPDNPELRCKLLSQSSILTPYQVRIIAEELPYTLHGRDWKLLYSMDRDGASLVTLLNLCRGHESTLVIISDDGPSGDVFGGTQWKDGGESYKGCGESFVFSSMGCKQGVRVWNWTRQNTYFVFCNASRGLGMGGGGSFAWFLDASLIHGSSGACTTFGNKCLTSPPEWICQDMEIWGFVPSCTETVTGSVMRS